MAKVPERVWAPALDAHDEVRDGAWVADLTGLLNLTGWPVGMRVIARKERPHPGAQLRITDIDGMRVTAFATNTRTGGPGTQLADLEIRHRRRARCEDRIRVAKRHRPDQPAPARVQPEPHLVRPGRPRLEISPWMQMLTLTGPDGTTDRARRWEPKRLRNRLFTVPADLARTRRQALLHLSVQAPWEHLVLEAITRLQALAQPG